MTGMDQPHVEPLTTPPMKENHDGKSEKYFLKLKLPRNPKSSMLDLYEFKMSLSNNGDP